MNTIFRKWIVCAIVLVMSPGILAMMAEAKGGPGTEWTVMVYIAADNNLDYGQIPGQVSQGRALLTELEAATYLTGVKVIALIDVFNNWDDVPNNNTRIYRTLHGSRQLLADWGERNTGDPALLSDFIIWTINNNGANKYALILFDHGRTYVNCCVDEHSGSDSLSAIEIETALSTVKSQTSKTMNLLGFDLCLTQYAEVAYQLRSYGTVMVASEETESGRFNEQGGWPYDNIITHLCNNKFMDAITLGTIIVDDYEADWQNDRDFQMGTMSAIYLPNMVTMAQRIDNFALNMRPLLNNYYYEVKESRDQVENFFQVDYIDLYHLATLIEQNSAIPKSAALTTAIDQLQAMIDNPPASGGLMINNWQDNRGHTNAHGLGICFGRIPGQYDDIGYESLAMSKNYYNWKDFARNYVMLRWEARTYYLTTGYQLPNNNMNIAQVTMNQGVGYSVDTIGCLQDYDRYAFMGVLESRTFYAKADGTIAIKGWFLVNDDFTSDLIPDRSYVAIYAIRIAGSVTGVSAYAIRWDDTDYAKNVWLYRSITISSLTPGASYRIGIGRNDIWSIDWHLEAKWEGVRVFDGSGFYDFTLNLNTRYWTYDYANLNGMDTDENIWHVDSYGWTGTPSASYALMGLSEITYTVKSDGTIRVQGDFRLHDTFSTNLRKDRSYVAVYVINSANGYMLGYSYAIKWDQTDYAQHKWIHRDIIITGLTPYSVVKIGVGRGDAWQIDYELTAEWKNLVVIGG